MAIETNGLLRPHYFERQQLRAADLTVAQEYVRKRLRRHNRFLHGWGVVCGAEVTRATLKGPWMVSISEGYLVTPQGDEIYIPDGSSFNVESGAEACLGVSPPCPDPESLAEAAVQGPISIIRANIDPAGKDVSGNYNEEWVDLLVLAPINLNGYELRHIINPGTPDEGTGSYFVFSEHTVFEAGTTIRVHSGAQRHHAEPAPEINHRYRAGSDEVGNWRLNNTGDTIFVHNAAGGMVTEATFLPGSLVPIGLGVVYLVACPADEYRCPQPAVPADCQPGGGVYEYSRINETVQFKIICDESLPDLHKETPSPEELCQQLQDIVCGQAHVSCPDAGGPEDNYVVLARIRVGGESVIQVDDRINRRQLLSESMLLAYLRCQCAAAGPPVAAFSANPISGAAPLTVSFNDQSGGQITSWAWSFGDGGTSSQQNPVHNYSSVGNYQAALTVTGPGGTSTDSLGIQVRSALSNCAQEILAAGEITVGMASNFLWPFTTMSPDGLVGGFTTALSDAIVDRLFDGAVSINRMLLTRDELMVMIAAGEFVDMFVLTPGTISRNVLDHWTGNYFLDGLRLLVIRDGNIGDLNDMNGAVLGSFNEGYLAAAQAALEERGIDLGGVTFVPDPAALQISLAAGEIDAAAAPWSILLAITGGNPTLQVIGDILTTAGREPYAIAVNPGCAGLNDDLDNVLEGMLLDGTWQALYDDWFPDPRPWTLEEMRATQPPVSPGAAVAVDTGGLVVAPALPIVAEEINALNIARGREATIEGIGGIGDVRSRRLRETGVDNVVDLLLLSPERTAAIAGVSVEVATGWQSEAMELLRNP